MSKKRNNASKLKLPEPRREHEEFGKEEPGIVICRRCNAYHFKKAWHHSADSFIGAREGRDISVRFKVCPACVMIKNKLFEGRVLLTNVPSRYKEELFNLIRAYARRAFDRDPQHRLIGVLEERPGEIVATFTENQLAVRTAKKVRDAFDKARVSIMHSRKPGDAATATVDLEGYALSEA